MSVFSRMHQLRTSWMAWWLALALVVAPALGRMHQVLHAPGLPQAHTPVHTHAHALHEDAHDLFGEHSVLECLVFDQLGHGCDDQLAPALIAHALPNAAPVWSTDPAALPAALSVFEARAPPHVTA